MNVSSTSHIAGMDRVLSILNSPITEIPIQIKNIKE